MTPATNPSTTASRAPRAVIPQLSSLRADQKSIDTNIRRLNECKQKLSAVSKDSPGLYPRLVANAQNAVAALYNQTNALSNLTLAQAHDITLHPDFLDRQPATIIYVDTTSTVSKLVDALATSRTNSTEPDLFLDTEQDPFAHTSWLQIYVSSTNVVYLVDTLGLAHAAFTTECSSAVTLKSILESPAIIKCFYDIRGDSHALFREFDIHMEGLDDLALWTFAAYGGKMDYAISLFRCVDQYCMHWFTTVQREDWARIKKAGSTMWKATAAQAAGMSEEELTEWTPPINERPLAEELEKYCVGDVTVMPVIRKHMVAKVESSGKGDAWKSSIADLTRKRTVASQVPGFSLSKEEQTAGPFEWQQRKGPHLS